MKKCFAFLFYILSVNLASHATEFSSNIPVVDMQDYYNPEKRDAFIKDVQKALHEVGFFAVINPGVKIEYIDAAFAKAAEFFKLDQETKDKYDSRYCNYQRGYVPSEKPKSAPIKDFKEFLHIGREFTQDALERNGYWSNIWPDEVRMEEAMTIYLHHLENHMVEMQHVLAEALEESMDFFDAMNSEGDSLLRVIHYPATENNQDKRAVWAGAHTDIGLFTILPKATAKGLEVQLQDGSWLPIQVEGDAFIINGADFLETFSNGYFKSAYHRVLSPEGENNLERFSMVFFVHPHSDSMIYPLPQWIEKTGGTRKYATATRYELLSERLTDLRLATKEMLQALGESDLMERLIEVDRASVDAMLFLKENGFASTSVLKKLKELGVE